MQDIFETHSHYTLEQFDEDRIQLLQSLPQKGVCNVIDCAIDYKSAIKILDLCKQFDFMYMAVGIHPESVCDIQKDELEKIEQMLPNKKIVAIGEIGLDYYWDTPKDLQKEILIKQLDLAVKHNLPVILHDREAHQDMLDILSHYKDIRGVMHCYSGSSEMATQMLKNFKNLYFGIGGTVTFKNAKKVVQSVQTIGLDKIILETDCPYMAPTPFRGKRCDSSMISLVAEQIAQIKQTTTQDVLQTTKQNAKNLFNIQ